jgi:membrane-bound metal-dependent hydrolase YbcI (DUF457 family)
MYILAHLLAGIILGVLLASLFRDARIIPACAFGSIFPDLIDKLVGILLFSDAIGYGRIYAHTLLFAGLVAIIGLYIIFRHPRSRSGPLLLAFFAGILSHQLLDAMWLEPINWFWPVYGPFTGNSQPDFFIDAFWREITNPTEWLAGIFILAFMLLWSIPLYRERYLSGSIATSRPRRRSLLLVLLIAATVVLMVIIVVQYW